MMQKIVLRTILFGLIATLFALPTFAQTGDTFHVTADVLNARTGPGIEYEIVARLGGGAEYAILDYSPTRNWVLLDLGFTQAWAFRHLGEVSSPVTVVTVPQVTTTNVDPSLGQGGGIVVPVITSSSVSLVTETGVDLSVTSTIEEFNSTIGVTRTLRLRFAPTFNSRIVSAIPYDQRATPIGRNAMGTWIQLEYEGTVGWGYFLHVVFPPAIDVRTLPITG